MSRQTKTPQSKKKSTTQKAASVPVKPEVPTSPKGVSYLGLNTKSPGLKKFKTFQASTMAKIRADLAGVKGSLMRNYSPMYTDTKQEMISEESERRVRQIVFLCEAVYEWVRRVFFHFPDEVITDDDVIEQAINCNASMKIEKFEANANWLRRFKETYLTTTLAELDLYNAKINPQNSLDILDIMTYCHRHIRLSIVELDERESAVKKSLWEYVQRIKLNFNGRFPSYQSILLVGKQLCSLVDIDEATISREWLIKFYKEFQIQISATNLKVDADKDELQEILYIFKPPNEDDIKPLILSHQVHEEEEEEVGEEEHILPAQETSASSIKTEDSFDYVDKCFADLIYEEPEGEQDGEPLPKRVRTNADALKLLKPLEEYAEYQSNPRVIGLLTQLEKIFKK